MTKLLVLDQPTKRPTEAEKISRAIRKVVTARNLVIDLTDRWIEAYGCYREARDRGYNERADRTLVELERLERASATAEFLLSLAEQAHRRLIGGVMVLLCFFTVAFTGCTNAAESAQQYAPVPQTGCSQEYEAFQYRQPESFPIHVQIDIRMPVEYRDAVRAAAEEWNRDFDADIFRASIALPPDETNDHDCQVAWVTWGGTDGKRLGSTHWGKCRATVELLNRGDRDWSFVAKHELGHVLNLQHAEVVSLMWPHYDGTKNDRKLTEYQQCLVQTALARGQMADESTLRVYR